MAISRIRKRDGRVADFDKGKIANAIFKAAKAVGGSDIEQAERLADKVMAVLEEEGYEMPSVEEVQDVVERVLIEGGHAKTAKAYILYRQKRAELREEKKKVLEKEEEIDDVDKTFDLNALRVLKARYLRKDDSGRLIETPKQLFTRIAVHASLPELLYDVRVYDKDTLQEMHAEEDFDNAAAEGSMRIGKYALNRYHLEALKRMYDRANGNRQMKIAWHEFFDMLRNSEFDGHEDLVDDFYEMMVTRKFMPNTPAIANFGAPLGIGSACFVLGIEDSLESIMDTLKLTAVIHQAGGGTGFNFSKLRPEGDIVKSTSGVASGPVSFITLYDKMTDVIKQGGIRRGANMGIMNSNHPDIEKFITAKEGNKALRNFNISVLIMPDFWQHYRDGTPYPLVNPRNGEVVRYVDPKMLFDMIVFQAWESAEPGVIFFDRVNEYNPFYEHLGPIVTTNPCVAADTLVATTNGLERIDSMKTTSITVDSRAENLSTNNTITLQTGCRQVNALQVAKTGIKEVYKLMTNSGYELTATPDHRILTDSGWKELQEITEKDSVFIQSGAGVFNENNALPFEAVNTITGKNGRTYKLNLPTEWSAELGLVLGWLTGDGWLSEKYGSMGLVFADEDSECRSLIQPIFEKYCNRAIKETKKFRSCIQVRSSSKFVVDFFRKLGVKDSSEEKEVPTALFTATQEAVAGFLQGLFSSDGTIGMSSESRNYIRLNSSSTKLLKGVQLLLLNLGIRSSIYNRSTKPKKFKYVNAKGELVIHQTSGINYELNISKENLPKFLQRIGFVQERRKAKAEKLKQFEFYKEYFVDKIKSMERVGEIEVWDITEPLTHSFIANGIVVHNCGEVLLYPNEPCNLGSINVWAFAKRKEGATATDTEADVDWEELSRVTRLASRFLDNVIDVNKWPHKQIEDMALATRKIGLGIMGLADLLYELRLAYNSDAGRAFMECIAEFVNYWSKIESIELAKAKGSLPYYDKSFYPAGAMPFAGAYAKDARFDWNKIAEDAKRYGIRNGYTTVIAPTGSISMIAGCSSGIEPVYTLVFQKNVAVGSFYYVDPVFEREMQRLGILDEALMRDIAESGGRLQNIPYIPSDTKRVFVTAMDITPEAHIRALAAFQKWVDSSISKTNNFPANATVEDMRRSYLLAYELGCKDVTVFRDSSIKDQVLVAPKREKQQETHAEAAKPAAHPAKPRLVSVPAPAIAMHSYATTPKAAITVTTKHNVAPADTAETLTNCPECESLLSNKEGCISCIECGWGFCSL